MRITSTKHKGARIFRALKLNHKTPKGLRKVKRPFWIEPIGKDWWFCLKQGQWVKGYNGVGGMTTTYYSMKHDGFNNAYSLKAVKRLVSKWDVPKGTKFRASLPLINHSFTLIKN